MGYQNMTFEEMVSFLKREADNRADIAKALINEGFADAEPVIEWNRWHTCYETARAEYLAMM